MQYGPASTRERSTTRTPASGADAQVSSPSTRHPDRARAAVAALEDAGSRSRSDFPGVHNLPLWRELNGSPIRLVGVRHEQTAAYAADGYARASGRLGWR